MSKENEKPKAKTKVVDAKKEAAHKAKEESNKKNLVDFKTKFGKFEKAGNGNFKCPVCKRSMFKSEQSLANHAVKCKGMSKRKSTSSKSTSEAKTAKKESKVQKEIEAIDAKIKATTDASAIAKLKEKKAFLQKKAKTE